MGKLRKRLWKFTHSHSLLQHLDLYPIIWLYKRYVLYVPSTCKIQLFKKSLLIAYYRTCINTHLKFYSTEIKGKSVEVSKPPSLLIVWYASCSLILFRYVYLRYSFQIRVFIETVPPLNWMMRLHRLDRGLYACSALFVNDCTIFHCIFIDDYLGVQFSCCCRHDTKRNIFVHMSCARITLVWSLKWNCWVNVCLCIF